MKWEIPLPCIHHHVMDRQTFMHYRSTQEICAHSRKYLNTDSWALPQRFQFSRSGMEPQLCISNKLQREAGAAGPRATYIGWKHLDTETLLIFL